VEGLEAVNLDDQLAHHALAIDAAVDELRALLRDDSYIAHITALSRDRLISGYALYGDAMFGWRAMERGRNVNEELADALNYLVSGIDP
jgi:hypothetical protein